MTSWSPSYLNCEPNILLPRAVWVGCSKAVQCIHRETMEEQMECADKCLEEHREREEQLERKRRRKMENIQEEALVSVQSSAVCSRISLLIMMVMILLR